MALTEEPQQLQNPSSFLDALLCEEENNDISSWEEDDELISLISKETRTQYSNDDGTLNQSRQNAVFWVSKVSAHFNFSALTTLLAVNYLDRFLTSLKFQRDKPWMTQLVAVASLSLAAKMEETQVPLLLDLQVEESKYVFEAKTIQRMELLVLSTLEWRMSPVTPISFFEHIARRLGLKHRFLHWEFLRRCERVLLSVIIDSKVMSYLPSTIAAAIIIHITREIEPFNAMQYRNQLLDLLKINEEQVNQCYKQIVSILCCGHESIQEAHRKRKGVCEPNSPYGVIDASFISCDSSNESWTVGSVSLSPDPTIKRRRSNSGACVN
ncbi:cyclin-D3-2 [Senna tora]|uniref:B-like cyclin n=1 Tax=Senna tora TaxID=362788 RepID=A0A834SUQ7_9FABA|nr:cyclin-D3-2 [Senna tora]